MEQCNTFGKRVGFQSRSIGGLILAHGDDNGLVHPPKLAPYQVVIVPVKPDDEQTMVYCRELEQMLRPSLRVLVDDRDDDLSAIDWTNGK